MKNFPAVMTFKKTTKDTQRVFLLLLQNANTKQDSCYGINLLGALKVFQFELKFLGCEILF